MTVPDPADALEAQIEQWRSHLRRHEVIHSFDLEELEDRLREHIAALRASGLRDDEAFLVAAKRVGEGDARARSFAREHAQRQWKQLGATSGTGGMAGAGIRREAVVAFGLAVLAALALKAPELFGLKLDEHPGFYARNLALFVLPFLAAYFVWKRKPDAATRGGLVAAFIAAAVVANAHAYAAAPDLEVLTAIHLPIALWLAVGVAYAGGRWREAGVRMDFVRFSGELFIYYVLIALGGVVLTGTMLAMFSAIGFDMEPLFERFILPCGAAGAV
ncbi:MAG TPA: hypothetical protein VFO79_16885, partial [Xanthomonadales bacterium]|nr:hypothetical protein [Xanthomonadales bacterium]